jgi:hypothetical protein
VLVVWFNWLATETTEQVTEQVEPVKRERGVHARIHEKLSLSVRSNRDQHSSKLMEVLPVRIDENNNINIEGHNDMTFNCNGDLNINAKKINMLGDDDILVESKTHMIHKAHSHRFKS